MQGEGVTRIRGLTVGHYTDREGATGCTVVLCEAGAVGGVDVRGASPGTRETDLLRPTKRASEVHAVLLSGGSAFGLDAAGGVVRFLEERGIGLRVGGAIVPNVPDAILFDLGLVTSKVRPGPDEGYAACLAARDGPVAEGSVGAGTGATVGKLLGPDYAVKGGIGTACVDLGGGLVVGAIVAVNAIGGIYDPGTGEVVAGPRIDGGAQMEDSLGMVTSADFVPRAAAAAAAATPAHGRTIVNSLGQTLVFIGPGVFLMGSSVAERGRSPGEDQRAVRITKGFWIGVCEVTRGQFEAFVTTTGYTTDAQMEGWSHGLESDGSWQQVKGLIWRDPGFAQTLDHPVVCVSRNDALAFCRWLGGREGRTYHLPTEAQWEYTCRAGSQTAYSWGDEIAREHAPANVADTVWASRFVEADGFALSDAHVYTSPVGTFPANAWGLFDMHGNVQEWCRDHYAPYGARKVVDLQRPPAEEAQADRSPYVLRGGSFASGPAAARSAHRDASPPHARFVTLGFRILLEEQEP